MLRDSTQRLDISWAKTQKGQERENVAGREKSEETRPSVGKLRRSASRDPASSYCQLALHSPNMLYLVGLGLADETDISVKGLNIVKNASQVYLEAYTSILLADKEELVGASCFLHTGCDIFNGFSLKESFYGREVVVADREMVETSSDDILAKASTSDVAFLVVGDPFGYGACSSPAAS